MGEAKISERPNLTFGQYLETAMTGPLATWAQFNVGDFRRYHKRLGLNRQQMDSVLRVFPTLRILPFQEAGTRGGLNSGGVNVGPILNQIYMADLA